MIESFIWAALIFGKVLYWFFLRRQTEVICETYWEAHLLRLRGPCAAQLLRRVLKSDQPER
jgi:hypothetical protein